MSCSFVWSFRCIPWDRPERRSVAFFLGEHGSKQNATILGMNRSDSKRSSVSTAEDQAAVDKVLAGDTSAFEDLVRRWQGPLVNLAYRFCRDRGRAEEMAQEAFLRAYRSLARWRREAAFSTWLFALATNLYCSELRRIPVRTVGLDDIVEPRDSRPIDGGLESLGSTMTSSPTVLTGIRRSSEQYRFVASAKSHVEKAASRRHRASER